jgi:hypothetical protein
MAIAICKFIISDVVPPLAFLILGENYIQCSLLRGIFWYNIQKYGISIEKSK